MRLLKKAFCHGKQFSPQSIVDGRQNLWTMVRGPWTMDRFFNGLIMVRLLLMTLLLCLSHNFSSATDNAMVETIFVAGVGKYMEGDLAGAFTLLEDSVRRAPDDAEKKAFFVKVGVEFAGRQISVGDYNKSGGIIERVYKLDPENEQILKIRERISNLIKKDAKSKISFDTKRPPAAKENHLGAVRKLLATARESFSAGEYVRVVHLSEEILALDPRNETAAELLQNARLKLLEAKEDLLNARAELLSSLMDTNNDLRIQNETLLKKHAELRMKTAATEKAARKNQVYMITAASMSIAAFFLVWKIKAKAIDKNINAVRKVQSKILENVSRQTTNPYEIIHPKSEALKKLESIESEMFAADEREIKTAFGLVEEFTNSPEATARAKSWELLFRYSPPDSMKKIVEIIGKCSDDNTAELMDIINQNITDKIPRGIVEKICAIMMGYLDSGDIQIKKRAIKNLRDIVDKKLINDNHTCAEINSKIRMVSLQHQMVVR